ncbi:FitA-like ribbon-helix-helix domain-containing protein [Endozoicomonas sp. ALD040]|uniref:FitA-like ribbon-helix-helix domain-containing protein n=1 Tax=unclassified Endozoicomonas TaxID=2644528 RepID=UPI003BB1A5B4
MAMMTLGNIPDELYSALKARAKQNNRSLVAEVRNILKEVLQPEDRLLMGDALVNAGRDIGLTDEEVDALESDRDKTPAEPLKLQLVPTLDRVLRHALKARGFKLIR